MFSPSLSAVDLHAHQGPQMKIEPVRRLKGQGQPLTSRLSCALCEIQLWAERNSGADRSDEM
jgi:hypothetical protein